MISTPHRQTATLLIEAAVTAGARRAKACAELEISDRTLRRWTKGGQVHADGRPLVQRPELRNKLSHDERAAVLSICNSAEFASLPPSQMVPKLADQGHYLASESSFCRILRAQGQQHHRGRANPPVRCQAANQLQDRRALSGLDLGYHLDASPVAGMVFYLYLIVDIFSRKIVGWEVHEREGADLAAMLVQKAVWPEACIARPLVLHADNGSPMKGAAMKVTLEKPGIMTSCSRPRASHDNPFSEALFRTCKYRPNWPAKGFATKDDAQAWMKSFASWYNGEHLHSAIRFVTPSMRHAGLDRDALANRAVLYANARAQKPERWSGKTRNWQPAGPVWLNPDRDTSAPEIRDAA